MSKSVPSAPFVATTPLEAAIHAGDFAAMVAALDALSPDRRHACRSALLKLLDRLDPWRWTPDPAIRAYWGGPVEDHHRRALQGALLVCGEAGDLSRLWLDEADYGYLLDRYRPRCLPGIGEALLPHRIRVVQQLVKAGLIERPASDNYIIGLIGLPHQLRQGETLAGQLAADPGLFAGPLWRLFEVEGTSDTSLAALEKYRGSPGYSWTEVLLGLAAEGRLARHDLLDRTLGALERDWIQFRSGWFSRFHAALAPTVEEMAPFAERYLGLCNSRIPPTVALAVDALAALEPTLEPAALLAALPPVLTAAAKHQVEAGLKLLDAVVARAPEETAAAAGLAVTALVHSAADLQKKVLARLARWGLDMAAREQLAAMLDQLAPSNRPAAAKLLGDIAVAPAAAAPVGAVTQPESRGPQSPLAPERALTPIADINELVEILAQVIENDRDLDQMERALDALLRFAPLSSADQAALRAVTKRARKAKRPVAQEVARLLVWVVDGELLPASTPRFTSRHSAHRLLAERLDDLLELAAQHPGTGSLAAPTHQRGFIAPAALVERLAAQLAQGITPPDSEIVRSLLRLAPGADESVRARARQLPDAAAVRALRYALGDDVIIGSEQALFVAAARIRWPGDDDPVTFAAYGDLGPDGPLVARYRWWVQSQVDEPITVYRGRVETTPEPRQSEPLLLAIRRHVPPPVEASFWYTGERFGGSDEALVRYGATVYPSDLEAVFAEGCVALADNLDWWEAQWWNRAYLELLLDPATPLGPLAERCLMLALAGKEPGQTALAIDALLAAATDGRLERTRGGETLRQLLATPLVKPARYARSLAAAAQASPAAAMLVYDLLDGALQLPPDDCPRDIAGMLELLRELSVQLGRRPQPATLDAIGRWQLGGKGRTLQKALLAVTR